MLVFQACVAKTNFLFSFIFKFLTFWIKYYLNNNSGLDLIAFWQYEGRLARLSAIQPPRISLNDKDKFQIKPELEVSRNARNKHQTLQVRMFSIKNVVKTTFFSKNYVF